MIRRKFIIAIAALQLLAAAGITAYTFFMQYTFRTLVKWEEMANVRTMMRKCADAIDLQRDTIDRIGAHLPEYGEALSKCATLLEDTGPAVSGMQRLLAVNPNAIPFLGPVLAANLGRLDALAGDLSAATPVLARDMHYTAEVMKDWTPGQNVLFISSLDSIVMTLRISADMLEEQWLYCHRITSIMTAIGFLVALAVALNAVGLLSRTRPGGVA